MLKPLFTYNFKVVIVYIYIIDRNSIKPFYTGSKVNIIIIVI